GFDEASSGVFGDPLPGHAELEERPQQIDTRTVRSAGVVPPRDEQIKFGKGEAIQVDVAALFAPGAEDLGECSMHLSDGPIPTLGRPESGQPTLDGIGHGDAGCIGYPRFDLPALILGNVPVCRAEGATMVKAARVSPDHPQGTAALPIEPVIDV